MATRTTSRKPATRLILRDNAPAYMGVRRELLSRIGKEWQVGDRLPSISELARTMGVGQNNAQRAVRELVAEGVLFSRRRLGLFVRQMPDRDAPPPQDAAQPLLGKTLGMASVPNPSLFIQRMMESFSRIIRQAGGKTAPVVLTQDEKVIPDLPGLWGMALFNPSSMLGAPPDKRNLVIVSTADHLHPELISRFDTVSVDQYQGGALAGLKVRQQGCEQAFYVGKRLNPKVKRYDLTSSTRLHGFESAWGSHLKPSHLFYADHYSRPDGAQAFAAWMANAPRPPAIFTASDELAMGFASQAVKNGQLPGRDFTIVGFDGQDMNVPASLQNMEIPTVRVPAPEMGRRAAELLIKRQLNPALSIQRVLLPCSMSVIKSS